MVFEASSFIISKAGNAPGYWMIKGSNYVGVSYFDGKESGEVYEHREQIISVRIGIHTVDILSLSGNTWGIIIPRNAPKIAVWTASEGFVQI